MKCVVPGGCSEYRCQQTDADLLLSFHLQLIDKCVGTSICTAESVDTPLDDRGNESDLIIPSAIPRFLPQSRVRRCHEMHCTCLLPAVI